MKCWVVSMFTQSIDPCGQFLVIHDCCHFIPLVSVKPTALFKNHSHQHMHWYLLSAKTKEIKITFDFRIFCEESAAASRCKWQWRKPLFSSLLHFCRGTLEKMGHWGFYQTVWERGWAVNTRKILHLNISVKRTDSSSDLHRLLSSELVVRCVKIGSRTDSCTHFPVHGVHPAVLCASDFVTVLCFALFCKKKNGNNQCFLLKLLLSLNKTCFQQRKGELCVFWVLLK